MGLDEVRKCCEATGTIQYLSIQELDGVMHHFLARIQKEDKSLLAAHKNIFKNYGFFHKFWKTGEGRARAANLESDVQNAMNR